MVCMTLTLPQHREFCSTYVKHSAFQSKATMHIGRHQMIRDNTQGLSKLRFRLLLCSGYLLPEPSELSTIGILGMSPHLTSHHGSLLCALYQQEYLLTLPILMMPRAAYEATLKQPRSSSEVTPLPQVSLMFLLLLLLAVLHS
jgi:hypothetical protein